MISISELTKLEPIAPETICRCVIIHSGELTPSPQWQADNGASNDDGDDDGDDDDDERHDKIQTLPSRHFVQQSYAILDRAGCSRELLHLDLLSQRYHTLPRRYVQHSYERRDRLGCSRQIFRLPADLESIHEPRLVDFPLLMAGDCDRMHGFQVPCFYFERARRRFHGAVSADYRSVTLVLPPKSLHLVLNDCELMEATGYDRKLPPRQVRCVSCTQALSLETQIKAMRKRKHKHPYCTYVRKWLPRLERGMASELADFRCSACVLWAAIMRGVQIRQLQLAEISTELAWTTVKNNFRVALNLSFESGELMMAYSESVKTRDKSHVALSDKKSHLLGRGAQRAHDRAHHGHKALGRAPEGERVGRGFRRAGRKHRGRVCPAGRPAPVQRRHCPVGGGRRGVLERRR